MQVARVEPVDDRAIRLIEDGLLRPDRPTAGEAPFIEPGRASRIELGGVRARAAGRDEILRAIIADIGLRRSNLA